MVRWLDIEIVGLVRVDFAWVRARCRKIVQSSPLLPPQLFLRLPKSFFRFKARDHHPEKSRNIGVCKLIQVALKIYVWCGRWLWFVCAKHCFFFLSCTMPKKREMKKKKSARARLKWLTRCYAAGQTLLSRHQLFELILERTFFEKSAATGVEQHHRNDQHHIWMSKRKEKNVLCATLFPSANRQAYCCRSAQQNSEGVDDKKANAAVAHKQQITFLNFNILQARQKLCNFIFFRN